MVIGIKTPTLDRVIADFRKSIDDAADRQDWQTALDSTFNGLLWRSVRLATRLNIVPVSFHPKISWKVTALQLRSICVGALAASNASEEADYRIEVVADVLNGLMDVSAALEAGQYKTADGAFRLTIASANLGRCELILGFAEEGFWEQVYEWRRRQGGKPKGKYFAPWKKDALPIVKTWVEEQPKIPITELEDKLLHWLQTEKGYFIGKAAVKTAIGIWREKGDISLPVKSRSKS